MVLLCGSSNLAAPTTQGPADCAGQGCGAVSGPRFSEHTNARIAHEVEWNVPSATKLRLDFAPLSRRGRTMDDDTRELIDLLCTRAGMVMEDASVTALTVAGMDQEEHKIALAELGVAANRINAIVEAATSLLD